MNAEGLDDIDAVLDSFATSCFNAGSNCTLNAFKPNDVLNFTSPKALLDAIDATLDSLYTSPVPIFDLPLPAVATAAYLRAQLFSSMYSMKSWPTLAEHLAAAFTGNFTGLVNASTVQLKPESVHKPDSSSNSVFAIFVSLDPMLSLLNALTFRCSATTQNRTRMTPRRRATSSSQVSYWRARGAIRGAWAIAFSISRFAMHGTRRA
jgi:hypothetical protein